MQTARLARCLLIHYRLFASHLLFLPQSSREDFSLLAARPVRRLSGILLLHGAAHKKTDLCKEIRKGLSFYFYLSFS